jgi:gluconolactonase
MHGEIWSIDPNGNVTVLVDNYQGNLLNGPNDLWIAPNGGIYFTDPLFVRGYWDAADPRRTASQQGGGFVYYLSPDRQTLTRVAGEDVLAEFPPPAPVWPNGIIGTPDGKQLYVGYFLPQRIYRYDINPDGSLSNRILFASRGTDGMTIDALGNIYTTSRVRAVVVFNSQGEHILDIPTGGTAGTSNVTFGGPNLKTLFITAGPAVFGVDMHVRGVK